MSLGQRRANRDESAGLDEAGMHDTADLLQQGIAAPPRRRAVARQDPGIAPETGARAHALADERVAGAGDDRAGVLAQRHRAAVFVVQMSRGRAGAFTSSAARGVGEVWL